MYVIECFILSLSLCYIVDISGFMQKVNMYIYRKLYGENIAYNGWFVPLLGCSKCLVFWSVLFYSLIWSNIDFLYSVGMACLCSLLATIFSDIERNIIKRFSDILNK